MLCVLLVCICVEKNKPCIYWDIFYLSGFFPSLRMFSDYFNPCRNQLYCGIMIVALVQIISQMCANCEPSTNSTVFELISFSHQPSNVSSLVRCIIQMRKWLSHDDTAVNHRVDWDSVTQCCMVDARSVNYSWAYSWVLSERTGQLLSSDHCARGPAILTPFSKDSLCLCFK